ncbi:MAG: hypothetical protein JXR94_10275 [Candidatus Hydrogenedentes bacterium]|nr:hypothetical protein [Candidatus Hydrogenedentota bacterium]
MSEVPRVYSGGRLKGAPKRRNTARRRFGCGRFLVLIILVVFAYAAWTTRDSCSIARLTPADQKYRVEFTDLLNARQRIAQSAVWQALPESTPLARVRDTLAQELALPAGLPGAVPDWILNNLFHQGLYVTGNDLAAFSDVLVLTKMSRVGTLIERLHGFVPGIERDSAGGLELRRLPDPGLYYAVRGRVLALSPSRSALVTALALAPEEALGDDALLIGHGAAGSEDVRGTLTLSEGDPAGDVFESIRFAAYVDAAAAHVKCRAKLRPACREQWDALLAGVSPQRLVPPPDGMLVVSANFGKSVRDLWAALGQGLDAPILSEEEWVAWESPAEGESPGLAAFFTRLLGPLGPGIRLSWCGLDVNEMFPTPEIVGTFDAPEDALDRFVAALPAIPEGTPEWASVPRFDEGSRRLRLPMIGGPSIEPTAGPHRDGLLLSTSRTAAERFLDSPGPEPAAIPGPGNLYVCIRPYACVERIAEAGRLLAKENLIRGHTFDSFDAMACQWLACAAGIDQVRAIAAVDGGEITLDVEMSCTARTSE